MKTKDFLWKAQRKILGAPIGRWLLYQDRIDAQMNPPKPRVLSRFNQWVTEKGLTAPWMMTQEECQALWKAQSNEGSATGNRPIDYASKSQQVINFLDAFWKGHVGKVDSILELGCNSGGNLNGLMQRGYTRLSGIEINAAALRQMNVSFPELTLKATLYNDRIEQALAAMPSKSVDVIYTMAVLIHIHPKSRRIFQEMTRVASKAICTIELEWANCGYVFARNYQRVFENLGCRQIGSRLITKELFDASASNYYGYQARLFKVNP